MAERNLGRHPHPRAPETEVGGARLALGAVTHGSRQPTRSKWKYIAEERPSRMAHAERTGRRGLLLQAQVRVRV